VYYDPQADGRQPARPPVRVQGRARRVRIDAGGKVKDEQGREVAPDQLSEDEKRDLAAGGSWSGAPAQGGRPADPVAEAGYRMLEDFAREEEAKEARQNESWRTLTRGRQAAGVFGSRAEAEAADAREAATNDPVGGVRWGAGVRQVGDRFAVGEAAYDRALAGSDNAADQLAFVRRTMPQLYNRAVYGPHGPQGGQAPDQQLMASLMGQAQQAAQGIFQGDTARGAAGVQEYGEKVTKPAERELQAGEARLAREHQARQGDLGRQHDREMAQLQASLARKASNRTAVNQAVARALEQGKDVNTAIAMGQATNEAIAAGDNLYDAARGQGAAPVRVDTPAPQLVMERRPDGSLVQPEQPAAGAPGGPAAGAPGGPAAGAPGGPAAEALKRARDIEALSQRLGFAPAAAGGKPGTFNVNVLAEALSQNPSLASDPAVVAMLARGGGGKTPQQIREAILGAWRRRAADLLQAEDSYDRPVRRVTLGGLTYDKTDNDRTTRVVMPGGRVVATSKAPFGAVSRWISGESSPLPFFSRESRVRSRGEASALGDLLRALEAAGGGDR
jgi:hypothetical protein